MLRRRDTARRLLWFILLWCAGVMTVGVVAWVIRLALGL